MALDRRKDAIPLPYRSPSSFYGANLPQVLTEELRRLQSTVDELNLMVPQVAEAEPLSPRRGYVRRAIASGWDPLSLGGEYWVQFDGSDWVAFP